MQDIFALSGPGVSLLGTFNLNFALQCIFRSNSLDEFSSQFNVYPVTEPPPVAIYPSFLKPSALSCYLSMCIEIFRLLTRATYKSQSLVRIWQHSFD